MARYQIIDTETGRKLRVIEWDGASAFEPAEGERIEPDDGIPIAAVEPPVPPVLANISDRQFAQALAYLGMVTKDEALAFVKRGEVPAPLQAAIDAIPDPEERFAVDIQVSGATTFERDHPSTAALAHALGWTPSQMDDLWQRAAALA